MDNHAQISYVQYYSGKGEFHRQPERQKMSQKMSKAWVFCRNGEASAGMGRVSFSPGTYCRRRGLLAKAHQTAVAHEKE